MTFQRFMKTSVFVFLLKFGSTAYAHDDQHQDIIDMLLKHAGSSIEKIEGNRIVFYSEKTCLYNGIIYVEGENGEAIDLSRVHQHLFYDGPSLSLLQPNKRMVYYICNNCTRTVTQPITQDAPLECKRCHHRSFLIRYQ